MNAMPLPSMTPGPRSTVCEVQRWTKIPVAEALETNQRYVRSKGEVSGDADNPLCEVLRWVRITVGEALRTGEHGRCVECQEPVRAHRGSVKGMAPHFEHHARNPRCSLSDTR